MPYLSYLSYLSYKERIVDFFSKKINNNNKILNFYEIEEEYYSLVSDILCDSNLSSIKRKLYFSVLYKLIFYTRDVVYGINNYEASYIMIGALIQFGYNNKDFENEMNILAFNAISSFIQIDGFHTAYGNWNDIKYFCNYLKNIIAFNNKNDVSEYQLFNDIIGLYVNQLAIEEKYLDIISTVTPCMPREKSKVFGWLAYHISTTYYQSWINTATTNYSYNKAVRKCLTHYRALISNPNKLPLYNYNHKEVNNKIIDNWTKLLFEVSNGRYRWADDFIHAILDDDEKFLRENHEIISKEIEDEQARVVDEDDEQARVVEDDEDDEDDEQARVVDEDDDNSAVEEEAQLVEQVDIAINPLFDENNTINNKQPDDDNKKSGWFGWLGWN
jgi:hypothetical protein